MKFEKAVLRAKVYNALSSHNEKITYGAIGHDRDKANKDAYVVLYYNGNPVGIAAY